MDGVTERTAPAAVTAVPRRMRQVCVAIGVVVVAVMAYVAATLPGTTNTVVAYGTVDQFAMLGLGIVLAAGIVALGRSRVDADSQGIRFRNIALGQALPWSAVRAVTFERKSPWASLVLENGDEVSLLAIQAVDGERALAAVEGLRALHDAARANDPKPPPLLY
jgi:hypothetical protein